MILITYTAVYFVDKNKWKLWMLGKGGFELFTHCQAYDEKELIN